MGLGLKGGRANYYSVIGFLSIALVFSADHTDRNYDLIDAIIDSVSATAQETKQRNWANAPELRSIK